MHYNKRIIISSSFFFLSFFYFYPKKKHYDVRDVYGEKYTGHSTRLAVAGRQGNRTWVTPWCLAPTGAGACHSAQGERRTREVAGTQDELEVSSRV